MVPRNTNSILRIPPSLTLLGPQSRFGDKLLIFRVNSPHIYMGVRF